MSSITEIEAAIEKLPKNQIEELAVWLQSVLSSRPTLPVADRWLESAKGAAIAGATTDSIIAMTRGDE